MIVCNYLCVSIFLEFPVDIHTMQKHHQHFFLPLDIQYQPLLLQLSIQSPFSLLPIIISSATSIKVAKTATDTIGSLNLNM